jgi:putative transposase
MRTELEDLLLVCSGQGKTRIMANHFHLVIETPQANLVAGMKWFPGTCTSRFNQRYKLFGHLFSGRY